MKQNSQDELLYWEQAQRLHFLSLRLSLTMITEIKSLVQQYACLQTAFEKLWQKGTDVQDEENSSEGNKPLEVTFERWKIFHRSDSVSIRSEEDSLKIEREIAPVTQKA